jgi:hypothetical protein
MAIKINASIKNRPEVLLNKSGSGWLMSIIIMSPIATYADCLDTISKLPLDAENKKNRPSIEIRKILKKRYGSK